MDDVPDLVVELPNSGNIDSHKPPSTQINDLASTSEAYQPKSSQPTQVSRKIPVTIITGYLGSGKSTLLENIAKTSKKKLAIILNEFGDSSVIEKSVTIKDSEKNEAVQEWLDLGNGCLCCTVKDNGVLAIEQLVENSKDKIDHILLETTGVADPAPIAKMFWLDDGLSSNIYIDGVVTVVDSVHITKCLDDVGGHWHRANNHIKQAQSNLDDLTSEEVEDENRKLQEGITTAHLQLALADTILINKVDQLKNEKEFVEQITQRIRGINSSSPIYTTSFGDIDINKILDLHAYDGDVEKINRSLVDMQQGSFHDSRIATVTLVFPFLESVDEFNQVESFLQYVLWEETVNGKNIEVHRLKGLLVQKEPQDVKVIQGVRDTYDIIEGGRLLDGVTENKLVFIGKGLDLNDLNQELQKFLQKK